MIVQVSIREADACGNESLYHFGFYESPSLEEAKKVFRDGLFVGFYVEEIEVRTLPQTTVPVPRIK